MPKHQSANEAQLIILQARRRLHPIGSDLYLALTKRIERLIDADLAEQGARMAKMRAELEAAKYL